MKINEDKIKNGIADLLWFFGKRAFWTMMFLIAFFALLSALVFYKYVFNAQSRQPQPAGATIRFDEKIYSSVLEKIDVRRSQKQKCCVEPD